MRRGAERDVDWQRHGLRPVQRRGRERQLVLVPSVPVATETLPMSASEPAARVSRGPVSCASSRCSGRGPVVAMSPAAGWKPGRAVKRPVGDDEDQRPARAALRDVVAECPDGGADAIANAELPKEVQQMRLDGRGGAVELIGDLFIRAAVG